MAVNAKPGTGTGVLSRRVALLTPLALAGCETFDGWFGSKKVPLQGKRESVQRLRRAVVADARRGQVSTVALASQHAP